jgi:hypothetical protein
MALDACVPLICCAESNTLQLLQKLVCCCEQQAATLLGAEMESKAAFEDRHGFQLACKPAEEGFPTAVNGFCQPQHCHVGKQTKLGRAA